MERDGKLMLDGILEVVFRLLKLKATIIQHRLRTGNKHQIFLLLMTINWDIIYADLNQGRLSSYHRLDYSNVKKHIEVKVIFNSTVDVTFSMTNVYSTKKYFLRR